MIAVDLIRRPRVQFARVHHMFRRQLLPVAVVSRAHAHAQVVVRTALLAEWAEAVLYLCLRICRVKVMWGAMRLFFNPISGRMTKLNH